MKKFGLGLALGTLLVATIIESRKKSDGFIKKIKGNLKKKIDSVLD